MGLMRYLDVNKKSIGSFGKLCKEYIKSFKLLPYISIACKPKKPYTEQFSDMIDEMREFRAKGKRHVACGAYQSRYLYSGKIKKDIKWRPITRDDSYGHRAPLDISVDGTARRNHCLLLGYSGANYIGSQRLWNQNDNTIEEYVLKTLLKNEWITPNEYRYPYTIKFDRASRTDKGVSAKRQCFSFYAPAHLASKSNIAALNTNLPEDIRIFDVKRVTKGFNARIDANARSYSYTLPTIAFAHHNQKTPMTVFRLSADKLKFVNQILQHYKGCKRFHNFTVEIKATDQSAARVMHHLECSPPFIVNGVEFAVIHVKGQSFIMHQIRKMIGLLLAVVREVTDESVFERAFSQHTVDIPTAPGLGLVLEQVYYENYNKRFGEKGIRELLTWTEADEIVNEFQGKFIEPIITQNEIEKELMLNWVDEILTWNYEIISESEVQHREERRKAGRNSRADNRKDALVLA